MFKPKSYLYVSTLLSAALLAGCSGAGSEGSEPSVSTEKTAMASLELANGHTVSFYDEGTGFSIREFIADPQLSSWAVTDDLKDLSLKAIYQRLAPVGAHVPPAILAADARYQAATGEEAPVVAPPPATAGVGEGPALYSDADQAWFAANVCQDPKLHECIQGWHWAGSNWWLNRWIQATAFINPDAPPGTTTTFRLYYWNGSQAVLQDAQAMGPGGFWRFTYSASSPLYWKGAIDEAGPAQLSLAMLGTDIIKTGPRR